MKKNRHLCMRSSTVILILAIFLCAVGTGYAAWSDSSTIYTEVSAGRIDIVFDPDRPCSVQIADINGMATGRVLESDRLTCTVDSEKKHVQLSFEDALLLEELTDTSSLLMLQFPLNPGKDNTISSVMSLDVDLTLPSEEYLEFTPVSVKLVVSGTEYPLPPDSLPGLDIPLYWDVYRQIEVTDGSLVGTIFLRLRPESVAALDNAGRLSLDVSQLPDELQAYITPVGDGTVGFLRAEIDVNYSFSVPLFIEQGHP